MARKVDVGEIVIIKKKNDEFFGKIGIVSDQDDDEWWVVFPGYRFNDNFYKKSNLKVITDSVELRIVNKKNNKGGLTL